MLIKLLHLMIAFSGSDSILIIKLTNELREIGIHVPKHLLIYQS